MHKPQIWLHLPAVLPAMSLNASVRNVSEQMKKYRNVSRATNFNSPTAAAFKFILTSQLFHLTLLVFLKWNRTKVNIANLQMLSLYLQTGCTTLHRYAPRFITHSTQVWDFFKNFFNLIATTYALKSAARQNKMSCSELGALKWATEEHYCCCYVRFSLASLSICHLTGKKYLGDLLHACAFRGRRRHCALIAFYWRNTHLCYV